MSEVKPHIINEYTYFVYAQKFQVIQVNDHKHARGRGKLDLNWINTSTWLPYKYSKTAIQLIYCQHSLESINENLFVRKI